MTPQARMTPRGPVEIDGLFVLKCGCVMDGCSLSHGGRYFASGGRTGTLWCSSCRKWSLLVDMVNMGDPGASSASAEQVGQ